MKIAIIPARGGSKRIPRKNIRPFCGKPVIAWSIESAKRSGCFDRVIVSTDDKQIADVARHFGAEVPFTRPDELSDDHAGTAAVIRHAVAWLASDIALEAVCCIYATAPFATPADLARGLQLLQEHGCAYVFSATRYPHPIQRALTISADGSARMLHPEYAGTRSQDLPEAFHDAGQFYWGTADAWLAEQPIFGAASIPLLLPSYRVQDIDTNDDWIRAERLFEIQAQQSAEDRTG